MKSNLWHELERVNCFGSQSVEYYKPLISEAKYNDCLITKAKSNTWYPLTGDMMICFLYAVLNTRSLVASPDSFYVHVVELEEQIIIERQIVHR